MPATTTTPAADHIDLLVLIAQRVEDYRARAARGRATTADAVIQARLDRTLRACICAVDGVDGDTAHRRAYVDELLAALRA